MNHEFQIRPEDVAAYIVFQFKGLEKTLISYQYNEIAQTLNVLKYAFIRQVTERVQKSQDK